jgi:hypothetical protein
MELVRLGMRYRSVKEGRKVGNREDKKENGR